jgi:3-carboxy-cis,cis-muconate cycloisomerase
VPVLPWHTDRMRVVELASALAIACAAMGKIARDVTLLAQTEVGEVREGSGDGARGGSSAMPHKRNPVAAVAVLGCTKQAPMLLASLAAAAEQELQRAAGGWHSEWLPLSGLLGLTASAASWSAELLDGLEVDADRMKANLAATAGLVMAEQIATRLAPALGRLPALDLVAQASRAASSTGRDLSEVLLSTPDYASKLAAAGVGSREFADAAAPENGIGAAETFVSAALAAHAELEQRMAR